MGSFTRRFALISDGVLGASKVKSRVKSEERLTTTIDAVSGDMFGAVSEQQAGTGPTPAQLLLGYEEVFVEYTGESTFNTFRDYVLPPTGVITATSGGTIQLSSGTTEIEIARGESRVPGANGTIRVIASGDNYDQSRVAFRSNEKHHLIPEGHVTAPGPQEVQEGLGPYQFKQRPTVFSKTSCLRAIQRTEAHLLQTADQPSRPRRYGVADASVDNVLVDGHINNPRTITLSTGHLACFWLEGYEIQQNFWCFDSPHGRGIDPSVNPYMGSGQSEWANHTGMSRTDGNICFSLCDPVDRTWSRPVRLTNISKRDGSQSTIGPSIIGDSPKPWIQSIGVCEDQKSGTVVLSVLYCFGISEGAELEIYKAEASTLVVSGDSPVTDVKPFNLFSSFSLGSTSPNIGATLFSVAGNTGIPGLEDSLEHIYLAVACEYLASGALMVGLSSDETLYSLASSNGGESFIATNVLDLSFQGEKFFSDKPDWVDAGQYQKHTHISIRSLDDGSAVMVVCAAALNDRIGLHDEDVFLEEAPESISQGSAVISLFTTVDGVLFSEEINLGQPVNHWAQGAQHGACRRGGQGVIQEISWLQPDPSSSTPGLGLRTSSRIDAWEADIVQRDDGYIQVYIASASYGAPNYIWLKHAEGEAFEVSLMEETGWGALPYKLAYNEWNPDYDIFDRESESTRFNGQWSAKWNPFWQADEYGIGYQSSVSNRLFTRTLLLQSIRPNTSQAELMPNMSPLTGLQVANNRIKAFRGAYATDWFPCNSSGQPECGATPAGFLLNGDDSTSAGFSGIGADTVGFQSTGQFPYGSRNRRFSGAGIGKSPSEAVP